MQPSYQLAKEIPEPEKTDKGPMKNRPILFLDLETTGLNPGYQEICDIGAVLVSQPGLEILQKFERKVKPEHFETASKEALQIIGYTPEKWAGAISLQQGLSELAEIGQGAMLAGFNVTFDWAFLQAGFNQVGLPDPFYYHRYDLMSAMFTKYYDNNKFSRFSLSECCRFFGITNRAAHTALSDAEATYEVYAAMMRAV